MQKTELKLLSPLRRKSPCGASCWYQEIACFWSPRLIIDPAGDACYGSLSPLVDKDLPTRLVYKVDLQETLLAGIRELLGNGSGVSRSPPSQGLRTGTAEISAALLPLRNLTAEVLPQVWLSFCPGGAPSKADCPLSPPVGPQWLCWCKWGFSTGSWEMPGTWLLNKQVPGS